MIAPGSDYDFKTTSKLQEDAIASVRARGLIGDKFVPDHTRSIR